MYNNRFKGQTEIIIVLAVLIAGVVAVFVATQTFLVRPETSDIANLKALLKSDMDRAIQTSASEVVGRIGRQGGYLSPPGDTAKFAGEKIPYWGACQNKLIPTLDQIKTNIKIGLTDKLNSLDLSSLRSKYGKEIATKQIIRDDIDILIRENDIIADVYLPTSIEGFSLEMPYKITIPVNLGRVYQFASDFIEDNSKNRHFEKFIVSLFYHSNPRNFPTVGILGKCGDSIFRSREELQREGEKIIDFAAAKTLLWQKAPPQPDRITFDSYLNTLPEEGREIFQNAIENLTSNYTEKQKAKIIEYLEDNFIPNQPKDNRRYLEYYLPEVNGRSYPDLDIKFSRGADLDEKNFQPSEVPVAIINSKTIYDMVPECLEGFSIDYSMNLPIVASVRSGDFEFNFATLASIAQSEIASCELKGDINSVEDPCAEKKCDAKVFVADRKGKGIQDTKVSLGPCLLGLTDSKGFVDGKTVCGVSELVVYNPRYGYQYEVVNTNNLNRNVTLKKAPTVLFHFNRATVHAQFQQTEGYLPIEHKTIAGIDEFTNEGGFVFKKGVITSPFNVTLGSLEDFKNNPFTFLFGYPFIIDTKAENENPIYVTMRPKNQNQWNPITIVLANGIDTKIFGMGNEDKIQSDEKESYFTEVNLTSLYQDGKSLSSLVEFETPINITDMESIAEIRLNVTNAYTKPVVSVRAMLNSEYNKLVENSQKSTASGTSFSFNFNDSVLNLFWVNTTKDGFVSSGQSAELSFSLLRNFTEESVNQSAENQTSDFTDLKEMPDNIQLKIKPARTTIPIDYIPADNYTAETTTMKKVFFYKSWCMKTKWPLGCKKRVVIKKPLLIKSVSTMDFEVREDDKELYINALTPFFNYTSNHENLPLRIDYNFSTVLPPSIPDAYCGFSGITRKNPGACNFTFWAPYPIYPFYTGSGGDINLWQKLWLYPPAIFIWV